MHFKVLIKTDFKFVLEAFYIFWRFLSSQILHSNATNLLNCIKIIIIKIIIKNLMDKRIKLKATTIFIYKISLNNYGYLF